MPESRRAGPAGVAAGCRPRALLAPWLVFGLLAAVSGSLLLRAHFAAPRGTAFVGTFYYVDDFYHYLSSVEQAGRGELVFRSKLAPPQEKARLVNLEWLAVGWLSRLLGGRAVLAYRLFGLAALACLVLVTDRWLVRCGLPDGRRTAALLLVLTGGGLGELLYAIGLLPGDRALDLRTGLFPFVEALANPHFVAGTTLLAASLAAFAAGRVLIGGALAILLALVRPYDAALVLAAEATAVLVSTAPAQWMRRTWPLAPLVPVLAYSAWLARTQPGFGAFANPLYAAAAPRAVDLAWALGPALLLAASAWPAFRTSAAPERAHLLRLATWAASALVLVALRPVSFALQFLVGAGLPLLVLGALGLARRRRGLLEAAVPAMATTAAVASWLALLPSARTHPPAEQLALARALRPLCRPGDLALAPPDVGLFLGGLTPCWPYVSHAAQPDYAERAATAAGFYAPEAAAGRARLLATLCPTHVVLPPRATPAGLEAAGYRPRLAVSGRTGALAVWSRDGPAPCR